MKFIRSLALLVLFVCPHAVAAVSLADSAFAQATSVVANTSASVGDLIIVCMQDFPIGTPTISDNKSGTYTLTTGFTAPVTGVQWSVGYKVVTVSGTPTITGDANTNRITFLRFGGFVGTATMLGSDVATADGDPSSSLNSGSFNTSKSSEWVIACTGAGDGFSGTPTGISGGWTSEQASQNQLSSWLATSAPFASGIASSITGTLNSSTYWGAGVYGFYDDVAGAPSPAPLISNGHPLISNGHPVISQ